MALWPTFVILEKFPSGEKNEKIYQAKHINKNGNGWHLLQFRHFCIRHSLYKLGKRYSRKRMINTSEFPFCQQRQTRMGQCESWWIFFFHLSNYCANCQWIFASQKIKSTHVHRQTCDGWIMKLHSNDKYYLMLFNKYKFLHLISYLFCVFYSLMDINHEDRIIKYSNLNYDLRNMCFYLLMIRHAFNIGTYACILTLMTSISGHFFLTVISTTVFLW